MSQDRPKAKGAVSPEDFKDAVASSVSISETKKKYNKKTPAERAQHAANAIGKSLTRLGKIRGLSQEHAAKIGEFLSGKHHKAIAGLTSGVGKVDDEFTLD